MASVWIRSWLMSAVTSLAVFVIGCRQADWRPELKRFETPYEPATVAVERVTIPEQLLAEVHLVAIEMPLSILAQQLALQTGLVVAIDPKFADAPITADLRYTTVEVVANLVKRQTGCEWSWGPEGLAFGDVPDVAVRPMRIRRLPAETIEGVLVGLGGSVQALEIEPSSYLLLGERRQLDRAVTALRTADAGEAVTWAVQLYLVSVSRTAARDLGLDLVPAVQLAATAASGPVSAVKVGQVAGQGLQGLTGQVQLQTLLRATQSVSGVDLLADPLMLVRDGESVSMTRGLRIPVRTAKTTNTQGQTITQGNIQTFQTGLEITCKAKEMDDERVRVDVKIESSDVASITDGVPSTTAESLDTHCDVQSGGVYLVGSLRREMGRKDVSQILQWGNSRKRDGSVMQVWLRAFKIRLDHQRSRS